MDRRIVDAAQQVLEGEGDATKLAQLVVDSAGRCAQLWMHPRTNETMQCRYHKDHDGRCKMARRMKIDSK